MTEVSTDGASLVTAFNARMLSARQVAQTFVPPQSFFVLINSDNTLLSGPRGSGKTTMLKMLQPEALEAWKHKAADDVRRRVTYTGAFIPTDRAWNAQLLPFTPEDMSDEAHAILTDIADSAFSTHVLRSMAQSMGYRTQGPDDHGPKHLRVDISPQAQEEFVYEISSAITLPVGPPTLVGLTSALSRRLAHLGRLRRQVLRTRQTTELPEWVDFDCLELADLAASLFNNVANQPEHQWALLFDELELAPQRIVVQLLSALRGRNPRLMFKLSFSPVHRELDSLKKQSGQATYGQDFEFIPLTYAKKMDALRFSTELLQEELAQRGAVDVTPLDLLGPSLFASTEGDEENAPLPLGVIKEESVKTNNGSSSHGQRANPSPRRQKNPYAKGTKLWNAYDALAKTDPSFAHWLDDHSVDLNKLDELSADERAARLRKVRNLVVVREFFRNRIGRGRSRKTYALYSGADALLTLTDGNPRLLIAMFRQLLPGLMSSPLQRIGEPEQSRAIETAIDRFLVLIGSLEARTVEGRLVSVQGILDVIGEKLCDYNLRDDFSDNTPGSFRVDRDVPESVIECLIEALNSGAIIHIPQPGSPQVRSNLRNETFRLCYLLAPYYQLPLRMGRAVALSSLLPSEMLGTKSASTKPPAIPGQESLFDFKDESDDDCG